MQNFYVLSFACSFSVCSPVHLNGRNNAIVLRRREKDVTFLQ